jgi:alginate O-acetyltransferase complex protein AlgI
LIFSAYPFLLYFLPVTWLGFLLLRALLTASPLRSSVLMGWLLCSSCWFYAQWHLPDLWVLFGVVAINFAVVVLLSPRGANWVLPAIVAINLAVLAFFKYWPWLEGGDSRAVLLAGLPLGISFYIFQVIAFQVDLSRGVTSKPRALEFALFLGFFPQLIAGPIVHGRRLLPQLRRLGAGPCCIGLGITLLTVGLAKKVLVADSLAGGVDAIYAGQHAMDGVTVLAAAFGYGTQLYFDFSGYADMAVGLGLLFGIRLPQNFRSPYSAGSLTEFWRRWHITLSSFLRDYLYISLGGNRLGAMRRTLNLMVTMTLGGFWHGAGLQFLLWGFAHGTLLAGEHAVRRTIPGLTRVFPAALKTGATLLIVMLLWIPFRASDLDHTAILLLGLFDWPAMSVPTFPELVSPLQLMSSANSSPLVVLMWSAFALLCAGIRPTAWRWALSANAWQRGMVSGVLLAMVLKTLADRPDQPFLYFQF